MWSLTYYYYYYRLLRQIAAPTKKHLHTQNARAAEAAEKFAGQLRSVP